MADQKKLWSSTLPSDVVEDSECDMVDSCMPERVPFGLPSDLPWTSSKQQGDSKCDSGIFESGLSGTSSVRSSYADSMDEMREQMNSLKLAQHRLSGSAQFQASERLPSVDEGFWSQQEESLRSLKSQVPEPSPVADPEPAVEEDDAIDNKILDIFEQDEDGDTKLHMAIIQLAADVALQMLDLCPDASLLGLQNTLGQAPLHLAVITRQPDIVRRLVGMGAPLEQRDRNGNSPLHLACREGDLTCVQALTLPLTTSEMAQAVYSVDVQCIPQNMDLWNYEGETCLHLALLRGHRNVITYLVCPHVQANINVKDGRSGRTPLHYAVESGDVDAVRFLIRCCRADVNAPTFDGSTALKLAMGRGFMDVARLLLENGAATPVSSSEESDSSSASEDEEMFDDIHIGGQPIST